MMSRDTGRMISSELDSIRQSVADILTTPIGSRVMRREYGSNIPDLLDQPLNDTLLLQIYSAAYTAIQRWEKRISIENITVSQAGQGELTLDMTAIYVTSGTRLDLAIPLQIGASA